MASDLTDKVAVITGASRGLGRGLAARFAERGLRLGLCARTEPEPPVTGVAATASVDVTDPAAVERFCERVATELGPIDLWVNNAGLLEPIGPLRDAPTAGLAENLHVNIDGVMWGSCAYARHRHGRPGEGVLVNITSGAARTPYEGWAAYCAAKAAVDQLTRVVAAEEAGAGLRAYAVAPGVVDTAMQAAIRATTTEQFPTGDRFRERKREGRFNSPAWVADHLLALAFDPQARPDDVVVRVPDEPRG